MPTQRFSSIWDAIEDTSEEAEHMKWRASLMAAITAQIKAQGLTQREVAALLGVSQPRASALMNSKVSLFSLDTLVKMAKTLGLQLEMRVREFA